MSKLVNQPQFTVSTGIAKLASLVHAVAGLKQKVSDVITSEIMVKVKVLGWTPETAVKVRDNDEELKKLQALEREFNEARMTALVKELVTPDYAGDLASMSWKTSNKGETYCNVEAYRVTDKSEGMTVKYLCRYSDSYNTVKGAWFAHFLTNPSEALAILESPDAALEIERIRDTQKEERSEKRKAASGTESVKLPEDAQKEVTEIFNGCESIKRIVLLSVANNAEFALRLPPYAERLREMVAAIAEEAKSAAPVKGEPAPAKEAVS